jgi:hypothetical protein
LRLGFTVPDNTSGVFVDYPFTPASIVMHRELDIKRKQTFLYEMIFEKAPEPTTSMFTITLVFFGYPFIVK